MLKTQADPRGCIYKKAHTTPDTSLDNSMLFFVTFITGICLTSPDLTSVQRTRGGHTSWKEGTPKTLPHLAPVPSGQWLGMAAVLSDGPGETGQASVWLLLMPTHRGTQGCLPGSHPFHALHHTGWQGWNTLLILHYSDPLPHQYIPEALTKLAKQRLTFSSTVQSLPLQ